MSGYFLYHSIGTFPGKAEKVKAALSRYSDIWSAENDSQWPAMLAERGHFIRSWENLIGAPAGSMTTAENVTLALYSLIGALPEELLRGRRILAAADCFPSLHFLLAGLQARFGFTLETVPMRQGESFVRDEDFIDIGDREITKNLRSVDTDNTDQQARQNTKENAGDTDEKRIEQATSKRWQARSENIGVQEGFDECHIGVLRRQILGAHDRSV